MKKYLITVIAWAALSYPIYRFIAPWAVIVYGVVSLLALLVWAGTRKGSTIKCDAASESGNVSSMSRSGRLR